MTNRERTGFRDGAYSAWHRKLDDRLSFLDVDWIERCDACKRILAVYELAYDNGHQDGKAAWATKRLAQGQSDGRGSAKGYVVLYQTQGVRVTGFRVRQVHPREQADFTAYTPDEWAQQLYALRWCHPITPREPEPLAEIWANGVNPNLPPERQVELLAARGVDLL